MDIVLIVLVILFFLLCFSFDCWVRYFVVSLLVFGVCVFRCWFVCLIVVGIIWLAD